MCIQQKAMSVESCYLNTALIGTFILTVDHMNASVLDMLLILMKSKSHRWSV